MKIVQNLNEKEKIELINSLYSNFDTGFDFELFLKPFLEAIGLTEVVVTKKTGDGGIDLLGVKNGLDQLDGSDNVQYKIQAKRNKPSSVISPEKIDALRGNLNFNQKGLFITTARVSEKSKSDAKLKDPSKPVIVIDGYDLVDICVQKGIGFVYKPIFSKESLKEFLSPEKTCDYSNFIQGETTFVSKTITFNDIRARIISIPSAICSHIGSNQTKQNIDVVVNGNKYILSFNPSRNYLGSVTKILKKYGLIKEDGTYEEKEGKWYVYENKIHLQILSK